MAGGAASRERGVGRLERFAAVLSHRIFPNALKIRGHVPSANLQDFRPPNERAGEHESPPKTAGGFTLHRLALSYFLTGRQRTFAWAMVQFAREG